MSIFANLIFDRFFKKFQLKTISSEAEIAQKLKNTLILGSYDVIMGSKRGKGLFSENYILIIFF